MCTGAPQACPSSMRPLLLTEGTQVLAPADARVIGICLLPLVTLMGCSIRFTPPPWWLLGTQKRGRKLADQGGHPITWHGPHLQPLPGPACHPPNHGPKGPSGLWRGWEAEGPNSGRTAQGGQMCVSPGLVSLTSSPGWDEPRDRCLKGPGAQRPGAPTQPWVYCSEKEQRRMSFSFLS